MYLPFDMRLPAMLLAILVTAASMSAMSCLPTLLMQLMKLLQCRSKASQDFRFTKNCLPTGIEAESATQSCTKINLQFWGRWRWGWSGEEPCRFALVFLDKNSLSCFLWRNPWGQSYLHLKKCLVWLVSIAFACGLPRWWLWPWLSGTPIWGCLFGDFDMRSNCPSI